MMGTEDIKWCPQHGYPLPCNKCGMPLSQLQQEEIYKLGKQEGINEVVEFVKKNFWKENHREQWQAKLKEWETDNG